MPAGAEVARVAATREEVARGLVAELPVLRRYAQRLCRNAARSDDLVQNVALRALNKSHLWASGTDLRAWLIVMTRNLFLSEERAARRAPLDPLDASLTEGAIGPPQERWIEMASLGAALAKMPPDRRELLLASGLRHETYRDMSRRMHIPLGTVRSRLFRARRDLRHLMSGGAGR